MQELVDLIRRDHAELDHLAAELDQPGRAGRAVTDLRVRLDAHLALLDAVVGPSVGRRSGAAQDEWEAARSDLVAAMGAARMVAEGGPGDGADPATVDELRQALRAAAEQLEQVVLPRLLEESSEEELSDDAVAAMRTHDALFPEDPTPRGQRAAVAEDERHPSRPAGSE